MHVAPDPDSHSGRTRAGILLFVLCCLLSTGRILFQAPSPKRVAADDIAKRSDQRFAALKLRLPASGVIGYIGEPGDRAVPDYYLTQYALAPLVVDQSPDHAIVIANFPSAAASEIPQNLRVVENFGNGVLLLASKDSN